jgi:hypothetical protein
MKLTKIDASSGPPFAYIIVFAEKSIFSQNINLSDIYFKSHIIARGVNVTVDFRGFMERTPRFVFTARRARQ